MKTTEHDPFKDWVSNLEAIQPTINTLVDSFDYIFTETLIRQQNFGDALVAGLRGTLERLAAEIAAKAVVFGLLSMIPGLGPALGATGFGNFITQGLFSHDGAGLSPSRSSGGGGVTINMPNVSMINSRSIRQIKQSLSRYDRLH